MGLHHTVAVLCVVWVALFITQSDAAAAKRNHVSGLKPLSPVDFLSLDRVADPRISPDGKTLAYLVLKTNWKKNVRKWRMRFRDLTAGKELLLFPVIKGDLSHRPAVWHPEGGRVFVILKRKGSHKNVKKRQVYVFWIKQRKLVRLTDHPENVRSLRVSSDGSVLYFRAYEPRSRKLAFLLRKRRIFLPFGPRRRVQLLSFNIKTKVTTTIVSGKSKEGNVQIYDISRDGKYVLYRSAIGTERDDSHKGNLWLKSLANPKAAPRQLTRNGYRESYPKISPNNKYFAFIATVNQRGAPYYEDNLFVQAVGETRPRLLMPRMAGEVLRYVWDETGNGLYFTMNTGLRTQLYHISLARGAWPRALTRGDHAVDDYSFDHKAGIHSFRVKSPANPGEAYSLQRKNGVWIYKQTTQVHKGLSSRFALPRQAAFTWWNRGQKLEGLLVFPIGYKKGKRYPLVTVTHGGPRSSSQFGAWQTSRYVPVLAGQGYLVFLPNHRGGTGYGDKFMRDMVGRYFRHCHKDILAGINVLVRRGLADPKRLVKMGWSAGGHMTNYMITFTRRFAAASSGAGAAEWASMYGTSDVRHGRTPWFGSAPWAHHARIRRYIRNSPLFYAWRVRTPTIFWGGKDDERVPADQNIMMWRGVRDTGTPTVMYRINGEPHSFKRPFAKLFKINTDLAWYAKYALHTTYKPVMPKL